MRAMWLALLGLWLATGPALAQGQTPPDPETLGEIKAEIQVLREQIDQARSELTTADPATTGVQNPAPLLQRVSELEQQLERITDHVEELQYRIEKIVADGTNRIGDLEFRLTELEGGDLSNIPDTVPLGEGEAAKSVPRPRPRPGDAAAQQPPAAPTTQPAQRSDTGQLLGLPDAPLEQDNATPPANAPQLAVSEQDAFDAALEAYRSGEYDRAAQAFSDFLTDYPGGPLGGEASFWRGEALAQQGQWTQAARSYLDSFSGAPKGPKAPEALYRLGVALGRLGQTGEACLTLGEVTRRYPDIPPQLSEDTAAAQADLGCS